MSDGDAKSNSESPDTFDEENLLESNDDSAEVEPVDEVTFDLDGDGKIDPDEYVEEVSDKVDKDLERIRARRTSNEKRKFPNAVEDYSLLAGFAFGALFFALLFGMSAGVLGTSTLIDQKLSKTVFDTGENPCEDNGANPWLNVYADNDNHRITVDGYNFDPVADQVELRWDLYTYAEEGAQPTDLDIGNKITLDDITFNTTGVGHIEYNETWIDGLYKIDVHLYEINGTDSIASDYMFFEQSTEEGGKLPWSDKTPSTHMSVSDFGPRTCWAANDLGNWGWALMGAELGGGRETAMLTGGSAGVPAWWMAFISLSLSAVTLFILYPLLYKVYHQDSDDMLGRDHIERVVRRSVLRTGSELKIAIDWETFQYMERDLSVDVFVAYENTESTIVAESDVRASVLKGILDEFSIFHVYKPVQLVVKDVRKSDGVDFEHLTGTFSGEDEGGVKVVEDYSDFFKDLHHLSRIEDVVRDALDDYFITTEMIDRGTAVLSDEQAVFVRVNYKPTQKLAFFRFKSSQEEVGQEIHKNLLNKIGEMLDGRELIVHARNEVATLADNSQAGRIEQSDSKGTGSRRVAAVAKQDGWAGRVLQTKFFGDVLSTVEYTANEKREFINKWGFWGLIVFVWIPFMASGVLVGAMLGLLSRMKFMRVMWACFVGGAAASITWAYTAEGIVTVMHKYKLEAIIPIAIAAFIGMAILHMRSTKSRRQTELFEDTMYDLFHSEIKEKYH